MQTHILHCLENTEVIAAQLEKEIELDGNPEVVDWTKIKGIGQVTMQRLNSVGIFTIQDVLNLGVEGLQEYGFDSDVREKLWDYANGV